MKKWAKENLLKDLTPVVYDINLSRTWIVIVLLITSIHQWDPNIPLEIVVRGLSFAALFKLDFLWNIFFVIRTINLLFWNNNLLFLHNGYCLSNNLATRGSSLASCLCKFGLRWPKASGGPAKNLALLLTCPLYADLPSFS